LTDLISPVKSARPWSPSQDAVLVDEFDHYNIPLAGLLEQHGSQHLFVCAVGEEDDVNVWLYAPVSEDDVAVLRRSVGDDFPPAMARTLRNRWVMAALAQDHELITWEPFDAGEESPATLVRRFLRRLQAQLARTQRDITDLDRDLLQDEELGQMVLS